MTERDRAAVDVDPLGVEPQLADDREALRGEGLVQLDEIELLDADARTLEQLAVMPLSPSDVFTGKVAPYFLVSAIDLCIVVAAGIAGGAGVQQGPSIDEQLAGVGTTTSTSGEYAVLSSPAGVRTVARKRTMPASCGSGRSKHTFTLEPETGSAARHGFHSGSPSVSRL